MLKYETNIKEKKYWYKSIIKKSTSTNNNNIIIIDSNNIKQKYLGMGGAITEVSCYNLNKLPINKQEELLNCYYSKNGLNYNWGRISIGSNDFSLSQYSYSYQDNLKDFSIKRDKELIIPTIKRINKINKLTLIASPWSPPSFMKNNKSLLKGKLKNTYYNTYVKYLLKYINEYKKNKINIKYLTIQNEPYAKQPWESCLYSINEQKDFIYNYLIKELKNTKVLLHDHNRDELMNVINNLYQKNSKIKGIAFHNYVHGYYDSLKYINTNYNDLLLIHSEGCCGYSKYKEKKWIDKAEYYLKDLINELNNGLNVYIDWNILLNYKGGPRSIKDPCASPIILNKKENDYILTPIYYYLGHINKYTNNNSYILDINNNSNLYVVAFKKNKRINITILNPTRKKELFTIKINNSLYSDIIKPHSIITYIK